MRKIIATLALTLSVGNLSASAEAKQPTFRSVQIKPVEKTSCYDLPYIDWGDALAILAVNGGTRTTKGSFVDQLGLCLNMVDGNDPFAQVAHTRTGGSPFYRGTMGMGSYAAENAAATPATAMQVVLKISSSVGDHCVGDASVRSVKDMPGKTAAIQGAGPHDDWFQRLLTEEGVNPSKVRFVWTKTLGEPAELLRAGKVNVACVVTPDMQTLTGGFDKTGVPRTGTGAGQTVAGAKVFVTTKIRNRDIVDQWSVRADWAKQNPEKVTAFQIAMLRGQELLVEMRRIYEEKGTDVAYEKILDQAIALFNDSALGTRADVHGLAMDANFAGYKGNVEFFSGAASDPVSFQAFAALGAKIAVKRGFAKRAVSLTAYPTNWRDPLFAKHLRRMSEGSAQRFDATRVKAELDALGVDDLNERTLYSFEIHFTENQTTFPEAEYAKQFRQAFEVARTNGGATLVAEAHVDPTPFIGRTIQAGFLNGKITCAGTEQKLPCDAYLYQGRPIDEKDTVKLMDIVRTDDFRTRQLNPAVTLKQLNDLSEARAKAAIGGYTSYLKTHKLPYEVTQLSHIGSGVRDPVVIVRRGMDPKKREENMRVVFRVVVPSGEGVVSSDFIY